MHDEKDTRLIAEMPFGFNMLDATATKISKEWKPTPEQEAEQAWVRDTLAVCGCTAADDITKLGCTGAYAKLREVVTLVEYLAEITRLRLGLAGGGVGLPCFVPPTRFCLAHNTIGGLQDNQMPLHPEHIEAISRELTRAERAALAMTEKARQIDRGSLSATTRDVTKLLGGRDHKAAKEALENDLLDGVEGGAVVDEHEDDVPIVRFDAQSWKCEEHTSTDWSCRYCLAQAVVDGTLEPALAFRDRDLAVGDIDAESIERLLKDSKNDSAELYVRVATFTRKLARD